MMSSPPSQQQPLSFSQYTNMLSSSPLKPSNFYFNGSDGAHPNQHQPVIIQNGLYQDENMRPVQLAFAPEFHHQFQLPSEHDIAMTVPASANLPKQGQFLQYGPRYDTYPHSQPQQLQQISYNQNQPQVNLFPPMEFMPTQTAYNPGQQSMRESTSTNTIASFDSVPLLAMSTSVSENSMTSPASFHNVNATPRRVSNRRLSNAALSTPLPQIYQTPSQNLSHHQQQQNTLPTTSPMTFKTNVGVTPTASGRRVLHKRTRSRLSLDASGAASVVTIPHSLSSNSIRSPSVSGTNPFYTPQASFLSPHQGSPAQTPLATPSLRKETSFSSISPTMLMNPGSIGGGDSKSSIYLAAADLTMRLATKYSENKDGFACDPISLNHFSQTPEKLRIKEETEEEEEDDDEETELRLTPETKRTLSAPSLSTPKTIIQRSQSTINLSKIVAPPEIKYYDILQPRKRMQKSQSTTSLEETLSGRPKKPKKMHYCPLCEAAFQRPEHVKRHMRSHSSEKPFACEEHDCGKRFNRPDNLKAHLRKIHHRTDV